MQSEQPKEPIKLVTSDHPALNFFYQKYQPAPSFAEATLFLTTEDIMCSIAEQFGDLPFNMQQLYLWMQDNAYTFDTIGDFKMVWLLKEVE